MGYNIGREREKLDTNELHNRLQSNENKLHFTLLESSKTMGYSLINYRVNQLLSLYPVTSQGGTECARRGQ